MPGSIVPTIGRKVWFWSSINYRFDADVEAINISQAFDATVVFAHETGNVNLLVVDHTGNPAIALDVELRDPATDDSHEEEGDAGDDAGHPTGYATWMPYQVNQQKASGG